MSLKSEAAARFRYEVCKEGRCFYCQKRVPPELLDACHLIPAVRLKAHTATLPEEKRWAWVYDPRLGVAGCGRFTENACHHKDHHAPLGRPGARIVYYEELPEQAIEAATEYRIHWSLEQDYPSLEELTGVV